MTMLVAEAPAKRPALPRFIKSIVSPPFAPSTGGLTVLKSAATNSKVGKGKNTITRGPYKGLRLFALTLPERWTCWPGCPNWDRCYGDNMPFAKRYVPGTDLEEAIRKDVRLLDGRYPGGFAVRLHVLGDFYNVAYVTVWDCLLDELPWLHIFGYTHRMADTPIGAAITTMVERHPGRCAILRSDGQDPEDPLPVAMTVGEDGPAYPGTILCLEQSGKAQSCLDCGVCMNGKTSVSFLEH